MCTSCRAVGYWFPTVPSCADCGDDMTDDQADQARADGYRHGDVCTACREAALDVLAELRANGPPER